MKRSTVTAKEIRSIREQCATQFKHELIRLSLTVEQELANFRYILHDRVENRKYTAIVLPTSFDYFEYRLNVGKKGIDMLIVGRHNAAVPIHVLSLETITKYAPLDAPSPEQLRMTRKRNSREDANLLLSKYILNFESAKEELAQMTPRSQQRYKLRRAEYLKPKVGRPLTSIKTDKKARKEPVLS